MSAAGIGIARTLHHPARPGAYRASELPSVVGYHAWLPREVPSDLHPAPDSFNVLPRVRQVDYEYDAPRDAHQILKRSVGISIAPPGKLVAASQGIGQDRRSVQVHGTSAVLDSWQSTETAPRVGDPQHRNRMIRWTEQGLDFYIYSLGMTDQELTRIASAMAPVN